MHFLKIKTWETNLIAHGFGTKDRRPMAPRKKRWPGGKIREEGELYPVLALRQVHGADVIVFEAKSLNLEEYRTLQGDALVTQDPGFALGVLTADCLPIMLFDPVKRAIGIVHAGWRGSAMAISQRTVQKMKETYHCAPADIKAALGPCIGPCCLEVDLPVKAAFEEGEIPWSLIATPRGKNKWLLNLREANSYCLERVGVPPQNIQRLNWCTFCHNDLFYSYRRKEIQGRQLNFIALKKC